MSNNRYAAYFAAEKQLKQAGYFPERSELISEFTEGEKNSLKQLEHIEYTEFIKWIRSTFLKSDSRTEWQNTPENKMRRKLWVIFRKEMNYSDEDFKDWILKYGQFKQPLNHLTSEQLQLTLVQAEKVLDSFTKAINKR